MTEFSDNDLISCLLQNAPQFMWFLGAGTSRTAGMPTATDITWDLKRKYYCLHENQDIQNHDINNDAIKRKIQAYLDSKGFPELWSPEEYSFYFKQAFSDDYSAQQAYINGQLDPEKVSLNIGHRALAALLELQKTRLIFTTNFDDVIESAFSEVSGKNLSAFHLEGSYAALEALNAERFPIYAKIHGDFRYQSIKNLSDDLVKNDEEIQKCFLAASNRYGVIVCGYSGRDDNVMAMFREALSIHICMDEIPTITIYSRGHPLETIILGMNKLNMGQIDSALEIYAEQNGTVVGTVLGVTNDAAVFTPTENWTRDLGFEDNTVHFVTWEEIRSLLGIEP